MDDLNRRSFLERMFASMAALPFFLTQPQVKVAPTSKVEPKPADPASGALGPEAGPMKATSQPADQIAEASTRPSASPTNEDRVTYCYDATGRCHHVKYPDGKVWKYEHGSIRRESA